MGSQVPFTKSLYQMLQKFASVGQNIVVFGLSLCVSISVYSNPQLSNVAQGNVSVTQSATTTTVNQSSQQAIINWNSFNIGAGEKTQFVQPNSSAVALNRINPAQGASQIYGSLSANGRIILINAAGIHFGPGSMVNVGSIIASTSDISNANFMAGNYVFDVASPYHGAIINEGKIIAAQHGLVALIGNNVENDGMIKAELGSIALGAGSEFTLDFYGDQLINFAVNSPGDSHTAVKNTGKLLADGGKVLVSADAAQGVLDNVVDMQGVARANSVSEQNGEIVLSATGGDVSVSGKLIAKGKKAGTTGGTIQVLSNQIVNIASTAVIDASGDTGGGTINIGGNARGAGPLTNAATTTIGLGALIKADAYTNGNGGDIVVWSNDQTVAYGNFSAQGGSLGGNGGYIETSGGYLDVTGIQVNLLAANGKTGEWLLDPGSVTINTSADTGSPTAPTSTNGSGSYGISATTTLLNSEIDNDLETANISINTGTGATYTITVSSPLTWYSTNTLSLTATGGISITAAISALSGGIALSAGSTSFITDSSSVAVNNFSITSGNWQQLGLTTGSATTAFAATNNFSIASGATFLRTNTSSYTTGSTGGPLGIFDIYGLEGMGTSNATQPLLANNPSITTNIDATVTQNWNNGAGFVPIGNTTTNFTGTAFNGEGHNITNLFINQTGTTDVGLLGVVNSTGSLGNVNLINVNITGGDVVGGFIGKLTAGSISSSVNVTGAVTSEGETAGGLIGSSSSSSLGNTSSALTSTATVTANGSGTGGVGGLIGVSSSTLKEGYAGGTVYAPGVTDVGGLIGNNSAAVSYSYATGSVTGGTNVGGLLGNNSATVTNTYSSGAVSGTSNVGGFIGNDTGGTIIGSLWDVGVSLQNAGVGGSGLNGTITSLYGGCFGSTSCFNNGASTLTNATNSTNLLNLELAATYTNAVNGNSTSAGAGWSTTSGAAGSIDEASSTSPNNYYWFMTAASGGTRPMLVTEEFLSNSPDAIVTPHQLQLMAADLAGSYTVGANIDLTNAMNNAGDVWGTNQGLNGGTVSGSGFVPIGTFTGSLNGSNNTINDLYINSGGSNIGLFSILNNTTNYIENLGLTNEQITASGSTYIGGLVGELTSGILSNVYTTGSVTGNNNSTVGGLVGRGNGTTYTLEYSYSAANVSGAAIGGLMGESDGGTLSNSYSIGTLNLTGSVYEGGLVGNFTGGAVSNSYASDNFTGTVGTGFGGLLGVASGGTITNSYFDISTTGRGTSGTNAYAVGQNEASISLTTALGYNTAGMMTGTNYSGWSIGSPSSSFPSTIWLIASGYTRPILADEEFQITNSTGIPINTDAPLTIQNPHQLQAAAFYTSGSYVLGSNINFATAMANRDDIWGGPTASSPLASTGFVEIGGSTGSGGTGYPNFTGTFNGNGYQIQNIYQSASYNINGLFGVTSGTIENLGVVGGTILAITGSTGSVGGIAGEVAGGGIYNSYANLSVISTSTTTNNNNIGGLVGWLNGGIITNSWSSGYVSGSSIMPNVGGLVGYVQAGSGNISVINSYSSATVTGGSSAVGGFIGASGASEGVFNDYSTGPVITSTATSQIGGFIGYANQDYTIYNSWSSSPVTVTTSGAGDVGGFVGDAINMSLINDYANGNVTVTGVGTAYIGGFAGLLGSTNNVNVFFDYATGNVTAPNSQEVGGFFGGDSGASNVITDNYSTGNVIGGSGVGGFGGFNASPLSYDYSIGAVTGTSSVGGFVGLAENTGINYTYSTGLVTGIYSGTTAPSNIGGFTGNAVDTPPATNFWDTQTSGKSNCSGTGTCSAVGLTTAQTMSYSTVTTEFTSANVQDSLVTGSVLTATTSPYFMFNGQTRPILASEEFYLNPGTNGTLTTGNYSVPFVLGPALTIGSPEVITTGHQLQLAGAVVGANYVLGGNINLTNTQTNPMDVWSISGETNNGFVPFGGGSLSYPFSGTFNGNGYVISNLYINSNDTYVGLFGYMSGGTVTNVGLTNVNIVSTGADTGAIAGEATNSALSNVYVTGAVTSSQQDVGGILGYLQGGTLSNSYNAASVTSTYTGSSWVGGLTGQVSSSGAISNSYNIGNISGISAGSYVGGLVGNFDAVSAISGNNSITNSWSSGAVSGLGNLGGLVGGTDGSTTAIITNSFWDVVTSGVTAGYGTAVNTVGTNSRIYPGCFGGSATCGSVAVTNANNPSSGAAITSSTSVTPANLSLISTYQTSALGGTLPSGTSWTITSGQTSASGVWFIENGQTMPILLSEEFINGMTPSLIQNAHQLELVDANLSGSFTLNNNIDLTSAMNNAADVFGTNQLLGTGAGFVPIGSGPGTSGAFAGTFNGNNYVINDLYINNTSNYNGLFGATTSTATIQNIGLTNEAITSSGSQLGGLVGYNTGTITNAYTTGALTYTGSGSSTTPLVGVGGIAGYNAGTTASISLSYSNDAVSATSSSATNIALGGLVGEDMVGDIANSYAIGSVTGSATSSSSYVGGFAGYLTGYISTAYNIGNLSTLQIGSLTNVYSSGAVSGASGSSIGGLIAGDSTGLVTNSFWDTSTSLQTSSSGSTGAAGYKGMTTAQMETVANFTTSANGFVTGSGWGITSTSSLLPNNYVWFSANQAGNLTTGTRPILVSEEFLNNAPLPIVNGHQLELISANLNGIYNLGGNIDLTSSLTNSSDVWGTKQISGGFTGTGNGFIPLGSGTATSTAFGGSLLGNSYTINDLYENQASNNYVGLFGTIYSASSPVLIQNVGLTNESLNGGNNVGGLVGLINGGPVNILAVYTTGTAVQNTDVSSFGVGGFIGQMLQGSSGTITIQQTYSAVNVSGVGSVGGYDGFQGAGDVFDSYAIGSVTATGTNEGVSGFTSWLNGGLIQDAYASGFLTKTGTGVASGFAGANGGTFTNDFYDQGTTGTTTSAGGGTGETTAAMMTASTFSSWNIGSTPSSNLTEPSNAASTTAGANTWFIFSGTTVGATINATRPILLFEEFNNGLSLPITNVHQLQLAGADVGSVGGPYYSLGSNVDFTSTRTNTSDIYGSSSLGFVPIGELSGSGAFSGVFNGNSHVISNLYINQNISTSSPLFTGFVSNLSSGTIENLGLVNFSYSDADPGSVNVGGIAGGNNNGVISDTFAIGTITTDATVTGAHNIGGLVGTVPNTGAIITNSYSDVSLNISVTSNSGTVRIGGLIGSVAGSKISNSYSASDVSASATGGTFQQGGLVGFGSGTPTYANNYFDSSVSASGLSATGSGTSAGTGEATSTLQAALPTGFGVSNWSIVAGYSYPYLTQFYTGGVARAISGTATSANATIKLTTQGSSITTSGLTVGSTTTGANGYYYFLEPTTAISNGNAILTYASASLSNAVDVAPASYGSINGLALTANTLTVGDSGTQTFSNANLTLTNAYVSSASASMLYTSSSNNITVTSGDPFVSTAGSTLTLTANLVQNGSGSITFNGPVVLNAAAVSVGSSTDTGSIAFNSNITGTTSGVSALTITSADNGTANNIILGSSAGTSTIGAIALASLSVTDSGASYPIIAMYDSAITTTGSQSYNSYEVLLPLTSAQTLTLNAPGGVTISQHLDGGENLTINNSTGAVSFSVIGRPDAGATTAINQLVITGSGATTFSADAGFSIPIGSINITGPVNNNNIVETTGSQTYAGLVTFGGSFAYILGGTIALNGGLALNSSGTQDLDTTSATSTISGAITGGTLQINLDSGYTGTFTLTNANSYGNTVINAGTLQIGNGGSTGSLGTGSVSNSGTLAFNLTSSPTISNAISGSGNLTVTNSGGITFSNTVAAGTVTLTNTTGTIAFNGGLTATTLTTAAQAYGLTLGGSGTITNNPNFLNTGALTLGTGGTLTFTNGVTSTGNATNPSSVTVNGTVQTNGTTLNLGAITLTGASTLATNNSVAAGASFTLGAVTSGGQQLTLNAGTGGVISGSTFAGGGNLIVSNSGGVTFSGAASAGTVTLTNTTGTIAFNGGLTATTLSTAAQAYAVTLAGSTITNAATFSNTGGLTLTGTDTFTGGVTSSASTTTLNGTLRSAVSSGTGITLGALTLTGASTIDSTNNGGVAGGSAISLGAISGNFNLTLNSGNNTGTGNTITGSTITGSGNTLTITNSQGTTFSGAVNEGAAGTVALTNTTGTIAFNGGLTTGTLATAAQAYAVTLAGSTITNAATFSNTGGVTLTGTDTFTGGVTSSASTTTLNGTLRSAVSSGTGITLGALTLTGASTIDSTNNGGVAGGSAISMGAVTGNFNLTLNSGNNTGTGNTITGSTITGSGNTLTITNSQGTTFSGAVNEGAAGTVALTNTTGTIAFNGGLTTGTLTTAAQAYGLTLGGSGTITNNPNFLNTGALTLGTGGTLTFTNGVTSTGNTTNPSSVTVNGTVQTNGTTLNLGAITLTGASTLATNNSVAAGASFTLGAVTSGGQQLTLNAGTGGVISGSTFAGGGNLIVSNSGGVTFSGAASAGTVTLTNTTGTIAFNGGLTATTLNTAAQAYAVTLAGSTITNAATFSNTGGVTLTGTDTFTGGVTSSASTTTLNGTLRSAVSSGTGITLGALTLTGASTIDSTNNGGVAGGSAISMGAVTGNFNLTLNSGNNTGTGNTITGSTITGSGNTLTITNSQGATFSGAVNEGAAGTVALTNTTGTIAFNGGLTTGTLTTAAQAYGLTLGGSGTITNNPNFLNTGALTLGTGGTLTFTNGVTSTGNATNPSSVTVNGTVQTNGTTLNLGAITLTGASTLATNNSVAAGASFTLGAVTSGGQQLTLNAGTGGVISGSTFAGGGNLIVSNSGGVTFSGAASAGTVTLTNTTGTIAFNGGLTAITLNTAAQAYAVTLAGSTITNAATFSNTGGVTLTGTDTFTGGVTSSASTTTLNGTLRSAVSSGTGITLGALTLTGASTIDSTNNGGVAGGSAISMGAVTGNFNLTLNSGNNTGTGNTITGSSITGSGNTLTITNSQGTTFSGAVNEGAAGTVALTNTTGTIAFNGGLTTGTLTTAAQAYAVTLAGSTITNAATFSNTGGVTLTGTDTFTGGVTSSASTTTLNGTLRSAVSSGTGITLGALTLTGASTIDSTNNGGVVGGSAISMGAVTGNFNLTLNSGNNTGTGNTITGSTITGSGNTLTITNSHGTTFSGAVNEGAAGTVALTNTTGTIAFNGGLTTGTLTTAAQAYAVTLAGSTITSAATFSNTGGVTLTGTDTFTGGVTSSASTTTLNGTLRSAVSSGTGITLGALTLTGASTIDSTNNGGVVGGSAISMGAVTGNFNLTLNSGNNTGTGNAITGSSITGSGNTLTITNSQGATFSGAVNEGAAGTVALTNTTGTIAFNGGLTTGTLTTAAQAYAVTLAGSTITNAATFSNTGGVTMSGLNTFTGGVTSAGLVTFSGTSAQLTSSVIALNGGLTLNTSGTNDLDTNSASSTISGAITGGPLQINLASGYTGTFTISNANSYGNTIINKGTLQIGNGGSTGSLGTGSVTDSGALVFDLSSGYVVGNTISGTGSLSQIGTGSTTLNASNTYQGGTSISAGTLIGKSSATSSTALGTGTISISGGILDLQGLAGSSTSFGNAITINGSSTIYSDVSSSGAAGTETLGVLTVSGNYNVTFGSNLSGHVTSGSPVLKFSSTSLGSTSAAELIASSGVTANLGAVTGTAALNAEGAGNLTASAVNMGSGTIHVGLNTGSANLTITGASTFTGQVYIYGGDLVPMVAGSLGTGAAGIVFQPFNSGTAILDLSNFTSSGFTRTGTITLGSGSNFSSTSQLALSAGTYTFGNTISLSGVGTLTNEVTVSSGGIATLSGTNQVTGSGILQLNGSGTLILAASNSYSGGTNVTGGVLEAGNATAMGGGTLTLGGGTFEASAAGLTFANGFSTSGLTTLGNSSNSNSFTLSGNLTSSSGTLTMANASGTTISLTGNLAGSATLADNGGGTLTIGGASSNNGSFSGFVNVSNNSTLIVASDANASPLGTGTLTLNGGTLQASTSVQANPVVNNIIITGPGTIGGANNLYFSSTIALGANTLNITNTANTISLSGIASSGLGGSIVENGTGGTLILAAANTYNGGTTLTAGTLTLGISSTGSVTNGPVGTGTLSLNGGTLAATAGGWSVANAITLSSSSILGGTNSFTLTAPITMTAAKTLSVTNTAGTISLTGNLSSSGTLTENGTGGSLTIGGASTNNGSYTGAITLTNGTFIIGGDANANPLGTGALALNGGTLQASTAVTTNPVTNPFSVAGAASVGGTNNITFSNAGTLSSGTLMISDTGTTTFSNNLSGTGALTTNTTSGTVNIGGASTNNSSYSGTLTLTSGTLQIASDANVDPLGTGTLTLNGGTLKSSTSVQTNPVVNPITVGGTATIGGANNLYFSSAATMALGANTLNITNTANTISLSGIIGGTSGSVVENGTGGTLILAAANTYTGGTTLTAGTLTVSNNSGLGTGSVQVSSGATLNLSNVTISNLLSLSGTGVGGVGALTDTTSTESGNITLAGATTISASTGDTLTLNGTINGAAGLTLSGGGTITLGNTVGNSTAPTSLTDNVALLNINTSSIQTAGSQTYNSPVALNTTSTLQTTSGGITIGTSGNTSGITWASGTSYTLNLTSAAGITINAPINAVNGGATGSLNLTAANTTNNITTANSTSGLQSTTGGVINVYNFNLLGGQWYQNTSAATLPSFTVANNFQILSGAASSSSATAQFLRAVGGAGTTVSPYQLTDIYGVQGLAYGSLLSTNASIYSTGTTPTTINAAGTQLWNSGAGFVPIGTSSSPFTGTLTGFGVNSAGVYYNNTISNLYINRSSTSNVGLFGYVNSATTNAITNIGLTNVNIVGAADVGGIIGQVNITGTPTGDVLSNAYVTGSVIGVTGDVGGLVGLLNDGTTSHGINTSYNAATVLDEATSASGAGGIVGNLAKGEIQNTYNMGTIIGYYAGGLVGRSTATSSGATVTLSYNSGVVNTTESTGGYVGSLIGDISTSGGTVLSDSLWDVATSGQISSVGTHDQVNITINAASKVYAGCAAFGGTCATQSVISNASNAGTSVVPVDLTLLASYTNAGWTSGTAITSTASNSATPPTATWFIFASGTRPLLEMEYATQVSNAHQLQLVGTTLGGSYTLANNINLNTQMTNAADVWEQTLA